MPSKTSVKKTPVKKTSVKKTPVKKTPAKKTPAKKTLAKKTPAKKTPAKKTPAKKTLAKKTWNWKIGDQVRPIGMKTFYTIRDDGVNKEIPDTWFMVGEISDRFPDGRYSDFIPKSVENLTKLWEKLN